MKLRHLLFPLLAPALALANQPYDFCLDLSADFDESNDANPPVWVWNVGSSVLEQSWAAGTSDSRLIRKTQTANAAVVEIRWKTNSVLGPGGVVANWQSNTQLYMGYADVAAGFWRIYLKDGGYTPLASTAAAINTNQYYLIRIETADVGVSDKELKLYIDDSLTVGPVTTGTRFSSGRAGFDGNAFASGVTITLDRFVPNTALSLSAVSPSFGPTVGGTAVQLTGTDLGDCMAVSFGSAPGTSYTFVSNTSVSITSPAGAEGDVPVSVAFANAYFGGGVNYHYGDMPTDTSTPTISATPTVSATNTPTRTHTPTYTVTPTFTATVIVRKAEYRMENNAQDSINAYDGTLVSGGPAFIQDTAVPIQGQYAIRTTAGYISLPVSVMNDLGTVGTIKYSFLRGDTDGCINAVPFSWDGSQGTGYVQVIGTGQIRLAYPTLGSVVTSNSTATTRAGRYYQVVIQYDAYSMRMDLTDMVEGTTENYINDVGTLPFMTGVTDIRVGTFVGGGGFEANYTIDEFEFYQGNDPTLDYTATPHVSVATFGDSIMLGQVIGGTCGNAGGLRGPMIDYWMSQRFNAYPYGTTTNQGTIFVNGSDAVPGKKLLDIAGDVTTVFNNDYTTGSAHEGAVVFAGTNDANAGATYAATLSNVVTIASKIHALSPETKVFFCTALERTDGVTVTTVNTAIRNGVILSGRNTYLIDTNLVPGSVLCVDGLHPDDATYTLIGTYIATKVRCAYLGNCTTPGGLTMMGVGR
mgnify:CR=1 FL=1